MAAYDLKTMLVVGVASSALFHLTDANEVFREHGEARYREYQEDRVDDDLDAGVAFPFIKGPLSLNASASDSTPLLSR